MSTKQRKLLLRHDLTVNSNSKGKFVNIWTSGYQFWNYFVKNQFKQRVILIQRTK